jgi:hypothetical protein
MQCAGARQTDTGALFLALVVPLRPRSRCGARPIDVVPRGRLVTPPRRVRCCGCDDG